jgi:hypothetical protein
MRRRLLLAAVVLALASPAFASSTIVLVNNNAPGVGLNDPTPVAPVGGNPGTTLGQQRLNVFQRAADLWAAELDSPATITVLASMEPLACTATTATLGSAGARFIFSDFGSVSPFFPGAEFPNVWYGSALASRRAGVDILSLIPAPPAGSPPNTDIRARFNSEIGKPGCLTGSFWYYGLDTNAPPGQNNLLVVLLHEIAHGLGFQQFANINNGEQILGLGDIYAQHLLDTTVGLTWNQMSSAQRAASAINSRQLVWDGTTVGSDLPSVMTHGRPLMRVNAPAGIAGNYDIGTASFGPPLTGSGVTGAVVLGLDAANAAGPTTTDGCTALTNGAAVAGKIALFDRGTCGFIVKVKNAQDAGAIAVLIADNVAGGPPAGLGGADPTIVIPSGRITQAVGNLVKANLAGGVNVTMLLDLSKYSAADGAGRPFVYNPSPTIAGSSISHWDTAATPNLLMEPNINTDLTLKVKPPEDLTLSLLRDIGWYADADDDGLADDLDACDASDLRGTIYIDGVNTAIANLMFSNGCTMADEIANAAAAAGNHGQFVSAVSHLGNSWKGDIITNQEHAVLVQTAAHSSIGH